MNNHAVIIISYKYEVNILLAMSLASICTFAGNQYEDGVTKIPKVVASHFGPHPYFMFGVAPKAIDVDPGVFATVQLQHDNML